MTFEVPSRYLSAFIKMADACRHIDTTAEHVAAMLNSPHVDVVIALWRDPDAPRGIGVWVVKGLPVLEAVINRGSIAKNFLQSEADRIERETAPYMNLAQMASASVKIIFDTVSGWREAGHPMREFEIMRSPAKDSHAQ